VHFARWVERSRRCNVAEAEEGPGCYPLRSRGASRRNQVCYHFLFNCFRSDGRICLRQINFSLACYQYEEPPADYLDRLTPAKQSQLTTLQSLIRQIPSALRLDINIASVRLSRNQAERIFGEGSTVVDRSGLPSKGLSLDPPSQITDLDVIDYGNHIALLASMLPLPLLARLHVSTSSYMGESGIVHIERYKVLFTDFDRVAAAWGCLESVQVCLRVTLPNDSNHKPDHFDACNLWVCTLVALFAIS
jgi:hypothetical protein